MKKQNYPLIKSSTFAASFKESPTTLCFLHFTMIPAWTYQHSSN